MRCNRTRCVLLFLVCLVSACAEWEFDEENREPTTQKVRSSVADGARSLLPVERAVTDGKRFGASSWDGRLFLGIRYNREHPGYLNYTVSAFRPEVMADKADVRDFTDAFSPPQIIEDRAGLTQRTSHQAVFKDPRFPINPFRSNEHGESRPNGEFETYKLGHFGVGPKGINGKSLTLSSSTVVIRNPRTSDATVELARITEGPVDLRTTDGELLNNYEPSASPDGRLLIWHGRVDNQGPASVVVASFNPDPMDPNGWLPVRSIVDLYYTLGPGSDDELVVDGVPFSKRYPIAAQPMRGPKGDVLEKGTYLPGAYPWLSFDASEAFFPTVKSFDGPRRSGMAAIGQRTHYALTHLDGLINPTRGEVMTRSIEQAPVRFPNLHPEGFMLRDLYTRQTIGSTGEQMPKLGYHRLFVVPVTLTQSMWSPVNRAATQATGRLARALTRLRHGGVLGTLLSHSMRYVEVDLSPAGDGHYLLYSPMHENLALKLDKLKELHETPGRPQWSLDRKAISHDPRHSVDMSGHFNRVRLIGAKFPYEYHQTRRAWSRWWNQVPAQIREADGIVGAIRCSRAGARCVDQQAMKDYLAQGDRRAQGLRAISGDRIYGIYGNAIYFPAGSTVEVDFTDSAQSKMSQAQGLTLTFWLKPLSVVDQQLVQLGGLTLQVRRGRIRARSRAFGQLSSKTILKPDHWVHVAVRLNRSTAELWIDGQKVADRRSRWSPAAVDRMLVGSTDNRAGADGTAVFLMDELRLSDVFRSRVEIGDAAFIDARPRATGVNELDLDVYLPRGARAWSPEQRQRITSLGRRLFFSRHLSSTNRVSCASCHQPAKAFTDGRRLAVGVRRREGTRNTSAIFNRDASTHQFMDGRAASLEAQIKHPFESPDEFGLPLADAIEKLEPLFGAEFKAAFGRPINEKDLSLAIASFQRTLVSSGSRFDRRQLTPQEQRGEALFFGKARCSSCHAGPNFTDEAFHHIDFDNGDSGRGGVTGRSGDGGRFKTPTLREIARTAPYFHDGSKPTLEAVVAHYNTAGRQGESKDFELQPIGLNRAERSQLVAFLKTLTGSTLPIDRRGTPLGSLQIVAGGGRETIWLVGLGLKPNATVRLYQSEGGQALATLRGPALSVSGNHTPTGWSGAWDRITFVLPQGLEHIRQFWVTVEVDGIRTQRRLVNRRP